MKKSLLALAVLTAVTGAASAQSTVTLYGKVDLGLVLDSGNTAGKSVRISSGVTGGSRLGFKGVEDLGGGMKASFQLETGYCADSAAPTSVDVKDSTGKKIGTSTTTSFCTGSNAFMGRQAHGDLTGAFGAMSAGRQYSIGFTNLTTIDPFGTGFAGAANNIIEASGTRLNNSFHYDTPSLAGFVGSVEIGLGEQTGNWQGGRETGAGLTYASGPVYVGFSFYDLTNSNGNGAARKNYTLGGTYDFGVVKVHALGQKSTGTPTGATLSLDVLDLLGGVTVPLAGGSLMADYINHNDRTSLSAGGNKDANQIAIGYIYPLSKRTSVYSSFARIIDKNGATFTVGNATESGTGNKSFNFGVVHNF
jgi:predicted porin